MQINLNTKEVYRILKEKFGEASFHVFYEESDKHWEGRNRKKISELKTAPKKETYYLYFDKD